MAPSPKALAIPAIAQVFERPYAHARRFQFCASLMTEVCDVLVIGAGPAGLAAAASLRERGLSPVIVDKADTVGAVWRRHYDRLHLHTHRNHSALPGLPMPKSFGRYPSRLDVIAYLESYAAHFGLKPQFGTAIETLRRDGALWRAEAGGRVFSAPAIVVATGTADFPYSPSWPGLETFAGEVLHSSAYRNPERFRGKKVLVVGFGNSGGEIALDLAEARLDVALSVRGPVWIVPRDLLGVPNQMIALAQGKLPARLADVLNIPVIRLAIGDTEKLGLRRPAKGPRRTVEEDGRIPLLDIGALAMIRAGRIAVRPDIAEVSQGRVRFADGREEPFAAIILATGFRPDLRTLLPDVKGVLNDAGLPMVSGRRTAEAGLFFCGAIPSATGQFREVAIEARRIADAIASDRALKRMT
jgi:cation diffusion facilitator CzcD-associated flavoprotein CzcO